MPPVNPERSEKIGLAHSSSTLYSDARRASRAVRGPIVDLQNSSRPPVGKPCASAPTRRSASLGEEAEVDIARPVPLGLAVQSVG